jgi:hypothetical protein
MLAAGSLASHHKKTYIFPKLCFSIQALGLTEDRLEPLGNAV